MNIQIHSMAGTGGVREGAGRKSRAEEFHLVKMLRKAIKPEEVLKILAEQVVAKKDWAIKMYMEYHFGKPKETVLNYNVNTEVPPDLDTWNDDQLEKWYDKLNPEDIEEV